MDPADTSRPGEDSGTKMADTAPERSEEVGLSSWPMSSSYPAASTNVQMETRKILRILTAKKETEVILKTAPTEDDQKKTLCSRLASLVPDCSVLHPEPDTQPEDETDGLTEDVLRPLVKLVFLKILVVDIGISVGDMVTDLLQGLSLVFDGDWNVQWHTYQYGLAVLGVMWIPGLVVLLHHVSGEARYRILPTGTHWLASLCLGILLLLCFPLLPTLLYLRVLVTKKRFRTSREKLAFLQLEAKTHELKAVAGAIESPLELVILLWLVLRGILHLPWDQPLTSSCVEDSLGRVACLPSLPMASIIFSLLSILKTLTDLNISPLLSQTNHSHSLLTLSYTGQLMAQLCPFFVCNVLLRVTAFAFIITYLDYWTVIPGVLVLLLMFTHTALLSSSSLREEELLVETDGVDGPEDTPYSDEDHQSVDASVPSPTVPILLNSLLGLLLPTCYTPSTPEVSQYQGRLGTQVRVLARRQAAFLRSQVLLVNCCTMTVVVTIYCLVTHTDSFNYRTNILDPWWFKLSFYYLVVLFLYSLVLSWLLEIPCLERERIQEQSQPPHPILSPRSRHLTEDSIRHSIHSASSHLVPEEQGPGDLHLRTILSLLLTLLTLVPSIAGIVLFQLLPEDNLHLVQLHEGEGGVLVHLTHLTSLNPQWKGDQVSSSLLAGCEDHQRNLSDTLVLLNMSLSSCRLLHRRLAPGVFGGGDPRGVVVLEDGAETGWRLSSPVRSVRMGPSLPVFRARSQDWVRDWEVERPVTVVRGEVGTQMLDGMLNCSNGSNIYVGHSGDKEGVCDNRKRLHGDGSITQRKCVRTICMKNGLPCHSGDSVMVSEAVCHSQMTTPNIVSDTDDTSLRSATSRFQSIETIDIRSRAMRPETMDGLSNVRGFVQN